MSTPTGVSRSGRVGEVWVICSRCSRCSGMKCHERAAGTFPADVDRSVHEPA